MAPAPLTADGGYEVEGGEAYEVIPLPDRPGWALLYLAAEAGAGVPGEAADSPGEPAVTTVNVQGD